MSAVPGTDSVSLELSEGVAVITLDNPPVGALSRELIESLRRTAWCAVERGARVIVVRSAVPRAFGVGADLKLLAELDDTGYREYLADVRACGDELATLPAISIAAIDGLALGGGLEIALACTFRVAGPTARLGFPEVALAMLPGAGGTQRLTHLVGRDAALDLMLSGRQVEPAEALALGLVSRVSEGPADAHAMKWAVTFSAGAPIAVQAILRCVEAALPYAKPAGAATEEREAKALFATDVARDAIRAFVDARLRRTDIS
jgi:enoyl-CoA hydratase/carnithine racemase